VHPVYRLDGSAPPAEQDLDHLRGYADSEPVRIGNAAYDQVQLDVLGEVLDALYLFDRVQPISWQLWQAVGRQLDWLAEHWREPDSGIWEIRGPRQQFVSSKLLVWVAFERAHRLARRRGLPGDRKKWQTEADAAYLWVQEQGWNPDVGAYTQRVGSTDLDASALLVPMLRFASGTDPYVLGTLDKIEQTLASDSMLYRYRSSLDPADDVAGDDVDGIGGAEASFTVCAFWFVENLARAGRTHEARTYFEKVLTYANEVGLFSEQIGPAGEALGNFPQALTHLALISAATTLDSALRPGA
jgi:GH15 family glucan-1,4-alpha-glucosidase